MDGGHHAFVGLRAGDRQNVGEGIADLLGLGAHAAGDDDLAVFGHRLADGVEALGLGAVEETAGVDDDDVGAVMPPGDLVAFRSQMRDDPLAVDQGLRAAEADEGNLRSDVGAGIGGHLRRNPELLRPRCMESFCCAVKMGGGDFGGNRRSDW